MSGKVISTILRHDKKQNSYKIALVRAINDVVLSFPDLRNCQQDVAVPLRMLAEFWVAYYWCFSDLATPIIQGQRQTHGGQTRNDIAFRPSLSAFRQQWENYHGGLSRPADGFLVIHDLRIPRKRETYPDALQSIYQETITAICHSLEKPIQYAGVNTWSVFEKPSIYDKLSDRAVAVPGTQPQDKCLVITNELWQTFCEMSLWVEALCVHEWCLFTEKIPQTQTEINRGNIYTLLTARPDSRRPLTWESNQIDLLLMEGNEFICPWTEKRITQGVEYDLDHLLPVSVYPINELWNLLPSDPNFNRNMKRDRLPSDSQHLHRLIQYLFLRGLQSLW
jgi:HNH endonuclease